METSLDDPLPSSFLVVLSDLPLSFIVVNLLIIGALLCVSGLVSGSEVAFFSLDPNTLKDSLFKRDKRIVRLLSIPKQLLATILILNNLVNVFIITLSTYATWKIVGEQESNGSVILILTSVITVLIIFFGEIVPKVFASNNPLAFGRFASGFILFFDNLLQPFSWLLVSMTNIIEKRIARKRYGLSVDELNQALEITTEDETTEEEKGILKGIVNFGTLSVKQIMRSRMDISAIDIKSDFHALMDQINKTGFSRIPVFSETIDKIEGILYIKDLLPYISLEDDFNWQTLLRPSYFVPESKKIDDLLKNFQEMHVHVAIVVDEYGGTEGLITLEDIIEEIVGEINDEFDEEFDIDYKKIDENTYIFEGKTSLNDFCKIIGADVAHFEQAKGETGSLGGLLLEIHSKLPSSGEQISFPPYLFTIVAVDQKRIKRVRVTLLRVDAENV